MYILFYSIIFLIGTLIGSFCSLAIYRIPRKENIVYKQSHCTTCNHKLGFKDLIPLVSYIFLKGKCRYCKQKIHIRYFLLEIFFGTVFTLFVMSFNINFKIIEISKLIIMFLSTLYIIGITLIAGIDKQYRHISKPLIIYTIIIELMYIIYLYILKENIYRYVMYFAYMLILIIIDTAFLRKKLKNIYLLEILILYLSILIFSGIEITVYASILTLFFIASKLLLYKFNKMKDTKIYIGYYLCISNIIIIIVQNFLILKG